MGFLTLNAERLKPADRILLIRLSALGDVVYALPALDALRRHLPKAFIAWAVEEAAAGLLKNHPQLDELLIVPRKSVQRDVKSGHVIRAGRTLLKLRRELRSMHFDWAIDLQGNLRSAIVARLSGARRIAGFGPPCSREHSHLLLNCPVRAIDPAIHKIDRGLHLLSRLGVPADQARGVIPEPPEDARGTVSALLAQAGFQGGFALIHPGVSRFGSFKQWPAEKYVELVKMLQERHIDVMLSAGPGEESLVRNIAERSTGVFSVSGLDLPALAELMRHAKVFIGSDTGPTQMAWMAGTPTIALMGPKDTLSYGPLGDPHRKIAADVPCRPCAKRACANNLCMKEIAARHVLEAAISISR